MIEDNNRLEWAAQWIEGSLVGETNERVIEFGKNMAMTLRAAADSKPASGTQATEAEAKTFQWTQGEWKAIGASVFVGDTDPEPIVADVRNIVRHPKRSKEEYEANARLIAAAPALVEALELWMNTARFLTPNDPEYNKAVAQANAVLNSARGEE